MKKILSFLLFLAISISLAAQVPFVVKGNITGPNREAKSVMMQYEKNGKSIRQSVPVVNGQFEFKGELNRPSFTLASIEGGGSGDGPINTALFYMEGPITITWSDKAPQVEGGGKEQQILSTVDFKKLCSEGKTLIPALVDKYPDSYVSLDLTAMFLAGAIDVNVFEPVFKKLSPRVKADPKAKDWTKNLAIAKVVNIGKAALDFTQPDVSGKMVSLSQYKGKYVLLDLWASWCGPCRATHPSLTATYQKFKDRNFDVLSISLDEKKDLWLKAIQEDGLIWTQASDLLGFTKNDVAAKYGITSIPQNFLIDPNGVIIAKNIHREELDKKLTEVLTPKK